MAMDFKNIKMKKYVLLFFISFFFVQCCWTQDDIPSVGILKLEAPDLPKYKAVKIDRYLESAFYKANRFNIVTRQLLDGVSQEREMQKNLIDNYIIEQGKAIGADYIVKGNASSFTKQTRKSSPQSRNPRHGYGRSTGTSRTTKPKTTSRTPNKSTSSIKEAPAKTNSSSKKVFSTTPRTSSPRTSPRTSSGKTTRTTTNSKSTKTPSRGTAKASSNNTANKPKVGTRSKEKEKPKSKTNSSRPAAAPLSTEVDQIYSITYISFTLKIVDVKTGIVKADETYKGSINGIDKFIKDLVAKTFPFSFDIVEILEMKGNKKAKHVLLYGGFKNGLTKNSYLQVYEVSEENVDGKTLVREIPIGMLRVKRMDTGGHFSLCKIYRGKKKLLQKINAGAKLVCKSYHY